MKNEKVILNYKYWSGHNQFYCNGKIMLGPNGLIVIIISNIMINLPLILLCLFSLLVSLYN